MIKLLKKDGSKNIYSATYKGETLIIEIDADGRLLSLRPNTSSKEISCLEREFG